MKTSGTIHRVFQNTVFKFRALRLAQIKSISSSDRLLIHFSLTGGTVKHMRRQGYKVGEEGLQTQPFSSLPPSYLLWGPPIRD